MTTFSTSGSANQNSIVADNRCLSELSQSQMVSPKRFNQTQKAGSQQTGKQMGTNLLGYKQRGPQPKSYIKPKELENFRLDQSTFERFLKIKNSKAKEDKVVTRFYCQDFKYSEWVPQTRDAASLLHIPRTNKLVLFGGTCQEPMKSVGIFNLMGSSREAHFHIMHAQDLANEDKVHGVFSLGSCVYKNKCYFFFGSKGYSKTYNERTNTN